MESVDKYIVAQQKHLNARILWTCKYLCAYVSAHVSIVSRIDVDILLPNNVTCLRGRVACIAPLLLLGQPSDWRIVKESEHV